MPEILIKNQALERTLEECAEAYISRYPADYDAFMEEVRAEEATLIKPSGMSPDGHMLSYAKLPEHLYAAIQYIMRKHHGIDSFFRDKRNYHLLIKVWRDLHVRKAKRPGLVRIKNSLPVA